MTDSPIDPQLTRQTFPELLHRNADRFGPRTAQRWRQGDGVAALTYAELARQIGRWAGGLMSRGIRKGDRAGIMAATGPRWMWADYAILCAGGITVTLYPTLRGDEAAALIRDAGIRFLFVGDPEIAERIRSVRTTLPMLEWVILLDGEAEGAVDAGRLESWGDAFVAADPTAYPNRWRSVALSDPMTIVYTSGTTGVPKGVVHTHAGMNAACRRDLRAGPPISEDDVLLSFLPLAHTFERQCGHGVAMQAAIPIAYSSPDGLLSDLPLFRPTVFLSVPRLYERIYLALRDRAAATRWKQLVFDLALLVGRRVLERRADPRGIIDLSEGSGLTDGLPVRWRWAYQAADRLLFRRVRAVFGGRLRFAFSAAGSLPADLCQTFLAMGLRVYEGYGATETCNTVALNPPDRVLPGSIGRLCPGIEARRADDGEWLVRGETLFQEYWNQPEATRLAFDEEGFYRTGDIVEEIADGWFRIIDRKHGLVVLDTGKNVPSAKIEARFPVGGLVQTVVPAGDGRKFVTAVVVPDFDRCLDQLNQLGIPYRRDALHWESDALGRRCIGVGPDVAAHPALRRLIDQAVEAANQGLAAHERIKAYVIAPRTLDAAKGELTPTLKVRRNVVLKSFQSELDALYA